METGEEKLIVETPKNPWMDQEEDSNQLVIKPNFYGGTEKNSVTIVDPISLSHVKMTSREGSQDFKYSPQINRGFFRLATNELEIFDTKTGQRTHTALGCEAGRETLSGDGKYLYRFDYRKLEVCMVDLISGRVKKTPWKAPSGYMDEPRKVQPNTSGICLSEGSTLQFFHPQFDGIKEINLQQMFDEKKMESRSGEKVNRSVCTDDGRFALFSTTNPKDHKSSIWQADLTTGKLSLIEVCGENADCGLNYSSQMPGYATAKAPGKDDLILYHIADGEKVDLVQRGKYGLSPDGKWYYNTSDGKKLMLHSTQDGSVRRFESKDIDKESIRFDSDNKNLRWGDGYDTAHTQLDVTSGKISRLRTTDSSSRIKFNQNGSKVIYESGQGIKTGELASVCVKLDVHMAEDITQCGKDGCDSLEMHGSKEVEAKSKENLKKLNEKSLCSLPLDKNKKDWDEITPYPPSATVNKIQMELYLKRFSKPQGFQAEAHLPVLYAALHQEFEDPGKPKGIFSPSLIASAMQGVLLSSPLLYEHLLAEFPEMGELDYMIKENNTDGCRTEEETKRSLEKILPYIEQQMELAIHPTELKDWTSILPLKSLLSVLPESKKTEIHDQMTNSLREGAATREDFTHLFASTVNYLIDDALKPIFGKTQSELTDVGYRMGTVEGKKVLVIPYAVGSKPIEVKYTEEKNGPVPVATDGGHASSAQRIKDNTVISKRNEYGFYTQTFSPVSVQNDTPVGSKMLDKVIEWKHGDKNYTASITGIAEKRNIYPLGKKSPDYSAMWKDKAFTGVHLIGSSDKKNGLDAYTHLRKYYEEKGFKFKDDFVEVPDLPEFLKKKIESNEADYMMKHAHSDGDNKNLVEMDKQSWYIKGTLEYTEGNKEEVYLIWPNGHKHETVKVPNANFGEWLRKREANGGSEFAYVNGSCWSVQKAVPEMMEANTPLLLEVASTTSNYFFRNHEEHGEQILLTAIREAKSFEEIRQAMKKNPHYAKGEGNNFVFPDEPKYKETVQDKLVTPMRSRVQMYELDKEGKKSEYEWKNAH